LSVDLGVVSRAARGIYSGGKLDPSVLLVARERLNVRCGMSAIQANACPRNRVTTGDLGL